jgi:hypothetical protein
MVRKSCETFRWGRVLEEQGPFPIINRDGNLFQNKPGPQISCREMIDCGHELEGINGRLGRRRGRSLGIATQEDEKTQRPEPQTISWEMSQSMK